MSDGDKRYGSRKVNLGDIIKDKDKKSIFDLIKEEEESAEAAPEKKTEKTEEKDEKVNPVLLTKIEKLIKLLESLPREDPTAEAIRELSQKIDILESRIDALINRIEVAIGAEEPRRLKELSGNVRKIALELEILPTFKEIPISLLAKRAGIGVDEAMAAIKELISKGWEIEVIEKEEKSLGIFSKKETHIVKKF